MEPAASVLFPFVFAAFFGNPGVVGFFVSAPFLSQSFLAILLLQDVPEKANWILSSPPLQLTVWVETDRQVFKVTRKEVYDPWGSNTRFGGQAIERYNEMFSSSLQRGVGFGFFWVAQPRTGVRARFDRKFEKRQVPWKFSRHVYAFWTLSVIILSKKHYVSFLDAFVLWNQNYSENT